jgi:hypothetical protein
MHKIRLIKGSAQQSWSELGQIGKPMVSAGHRPARAQM